MDKEELIKEDKMLATELNDLEKQINDMRIKQILDPSYQPTFLDIKNLERAEKIKSRRQEIEYILKKE